MGTRNNLGKPFAGEDPYVFISYSHRDDTVLSEVLAVLGHQGIRYWYDNGLNSGDDWNSVIAHRLESSTICLLLLSPNSAASDYVKNELQFAINHRIPIHTLLVAEFDIPSDIEIMITRIQAITMTEGFGERLSEAFPPDVFEGAKESRDASDEPYSHVLYQLDNQIMERQGTKHWLCTHRHLGYSVLMQEDQLKLEELSKARQLAERVAKLDHPLFPRLYDVVFEKSRMYTFQEYRGEAFLDSYLENNKPDEGQILAWTRRIVEGLDYLYSQNLAVRDLARGSLTVTGDAQIRLFRLQNLYYGAFPLQLENRRFYFEREVLEIGVLLYQLCTGTPPTLPFGMISEDRFGRRFLDRINWIVQNCAKEKGVLHYQSFAMILDDLDEKGIDLKQRLFLRRRAQLLGRYEAVKQRNMLHFTANVDNRTNEIGTTDNLEERFGFEGTVRVSDSQGRDDGTHIQLMVCSTGQIIDCLKKTVVIGRGIQADVILDQPRISVRHCRLTLQGDGCYRIEDLNSTNGTFVVRGGSNREKIDQSCIVEKGTILSLANIQVMIM